MHHNDENGFFEGLFCFFKNLRESMGSRKKFFSFLRRNIPNILTLSRIFASFFIHSLMMGALYSFFVHRQIVWDPSLTKITICLVIYAQVSDFIDGLLAWLLEIETEWGGLIDRYADKILNTPFFLWMIAFYIIILASNLSNILVYLIIAFLLALATLEVILAWYAHKGSQLKLRIKPSWAGKIKMFLECVLATVWLIGFLVPGIWNLNSSSQEGMKLILVILILATFFALGSAYGYYKDHGRELSIR